MIENFPFTHSQREILKKIEKDFKIWDIGTLKQFFPQEILDKTLNPKEKAKKLFNYYQNLHKYYRNQRITLRKF